MIETLIVIALLMINLTLLAQVTIIMVLFIPKKTKTKILESSEGTANKTLVLPTFQAPQETTVINPPAGEKEYQESEAARILKEKNEQEVEKVIQKSMAKFQEAYQTTLEQVMSGNMPTKEEKE